MTFWQLFIRLLPWRPWQALAAAYWHVTRRRIRAGNLLRVASAELPFTYAMWIKHKERNDELARDCERTMRSWDWRPRFSIIVWSDGKKPEAPSDGLSRSLDRQFYSNWAIIDGRYMTVRESMAAADGDFVLLLDPKDELSEAGLFRLAEALQTRPEAVIVYGDQDELDPHGRRVHPWFKPRWNREMFLGQNYLSATSAIKVSVAREASLKAANLSEMILAAISRAEDRVVHVPHIVCHAAPRPASDDEWLDAVGRHVQTSGARSVRGPFGTVKVEWPLPDDVPFVSIIVPTKDKLNLLRPCIDGILHRTSYANFEIVVVDNASTDSKTLQFFDEINRDPRARVISYPGPYNFSAINNFAARKTRGSFLCFLNNDTEVLESDWLTDMMRYALRSEIGAVGAKLLYEDGSVQHAGVIVGMGGAAGHAHRFLPAGEPGYFRQPHVTHFVSAVTAACLVLDKRKFFAVGGFDEAELSVAFNDVDLCLKLQAAGFRNVYVPHAVLLHHESKSRGSDMSPRNIERYKRELKVLQDRWRTDAYDDPQLNPNLDPATESFVIRL